MSRQSLVVLALVLLAACAEPPMGPSGTNSSRSGQSQPSRPPQQTCQAPDTDPLTTVPGTLAKQCGAKQ
jgi:hypothetical protein